MRIVALFIFLLSLPGTHQAPAVLSNLNPSEPLSDRIANYVIDVKLDEHNHAVTGSCQISWINPSPDTVSQTRLHMYLNAFSDGQSSYLRTGRGLGADQIDGRPEADWGSVEVSSAQQHGIVLNQRYVAPNDSNVNDRSVLELALANPVLPGDTLVLEMTFTSKLPRIIARSGFAEHGFMHWVHWYPKLGVYEQDRAGTWGWNCHQFLPQMEFYGDHGNYQVTVNAPAHWTLGGSGQMAKAPLDNGRAQFHFFAHDVIDFGWVASPLLSEKIAEWEHVRMRLLHPESHNGHVDRLMQAAIFGLQYMTKHVGPYPYHTLTILDPPVYGLRSGFMEYPTYITGGSYYAWPTQIRTIESLVLHEFAHQYFMQMVANNEKEEPWLDEGFVTYYEDRIMEAMLGEQSSLFDIFGYHVSNSDFTRNEYVSIAHDQLDPIATRSWEIKRHYKGIVYSKTATFLKTMDRYLGRDVFDQLMQDYFNRYKFSHPRGEDFVAMLKTFCAKHPSLLGEQADSVIDQAIYGTDYCDYSVEDLEETRSEGGFAQKIVLKNAGSLTIPVEVKIEFVDSTEKVLTWDGLQETKTIELLSDVAIRLVEIDPKQLNLLDIDLNNNSYSMQTGSLGRFKYAAKIAFWLQQISNTLSVII